MLNFLKKYGHFLFWPLVATIIFVPTFGSTVLLPSPDWIYYFTDYLRITLVERLLSSSASVAAGDFLEVILPPLFYHDFTYWLNVVLAATGFYWFMREREMPRLAALFGGGAMAFAGYSFTLVLAGHHAYFEMMPYIPFTFAFIARGFRKRSLLCFFLAGCSAAWVFRFGPDIGTSMLVVAALYAIWLFVRSARKSAGSFPFSRFAAGCALALFAFALVAAPSIYTVVTETLTWRKQQIEQSSGTALTRDSAQIGSVQAGSAQSSAEKSKDAEEKWIFATNWSFPPSESLELIAPSYKGTWNGDPKLPYWGELGRSAGWTPSNPGSGFFNFRQHNVYLGALPVAFILLAVTAFALTRGKRRGASADGEGEPADYFADVPFWLAIAVVAILLAFGRYTPFYRLFYSIPLMSNLRAPVKFIRIVEFSSAVLASAGVAALLSGALRARAAKFFAGSLFIFAVALFVYTLRISADPARFASILVDLKARALVEPAAKQAVQSIWHAIAGFAAVGVVVFSVASKWIKGTIGAAIMVAALAVDLSLSVRPFMVTKDFGSDFARNSVTKHVTDGIDNVKSVTVLGFQSPEWLTRSLATQFVRKYPLDNPEIDNNAFLAASGADVSRMCQLTGSQLLLLPVQMVRALDTSLFARADYLSFNETGTALIPARAGNAQLALLKVLNPLPYARMYSKFAVSSPDSWYTDIARTMGRGKDDVLQVSAAPSCAESSAPGTVSFISRRYVDGAFATRIETDAPAAQLLFINEPFNDKLEYLVDDIPVKPLLAGYVQGVAVEVPGGRHLVTVRHKTSIGLFAWSASVFLLVAALASFELIPALRRRRGSCACCKVPSADIRS